MSSDDRSRCWQKLRKLAASGAPQLDLRHADIRQLSAAGITLDYTRSRINPAILSVASELLDACAISEKFAGLLAGKKINFTEKRAAWHSQLRAPATADPEVGKQLKAALEFAGKVREGEIRGAGGAYRTIVHIGIGGSYLGPRLLTEALGCDGPRPHFVANIDPSALKDALSECDPATTLVIAASKSGTTAETRANADAAKAWLAADLGQQQAAKQLAVISANPKAAQIYGCPSDQLFAIWDWVGGRYSLWSAVSLAAMIACGPSKFERFLAGAHAMDMHAAEQDGLANMPALLAFLSCWHSLALGSQTHCVVAYSHRLRSLPSYLQQLTMESNGKSATLTGASPETATGEIWWGGEGSNDEHSYFQLLLQGTHSVATDFIALLRPQDSEDEALHRELLAHCFGMSRALAVGRDLPTSLAELESSGASPEQAAVLAPHLVVAGGQPTNLIIAQQLTPETTGALLALYEHQVAATGWLHDINSFDQFGVEFGKQNYRTVADWLAGNQTAELDKPTAELVRLVSKAGKPAA